MGDAFLAMHPATKNCIAPHGIPHTRAHRKTSGTAVHRLQLRPHEFTERNELLASCRSESGADSQRRIAWMKAVNPSMKKQPDRLLPRLMMCQRLQVRLTRRGVTMLSRIPGQ